MTPLSVTCLYDLTAKPELRDAMEQALIALQRAIRACEGCLGADLFVDTSDDTLFVFIEHWQTQDDRNASGAALGKGIFGPIIDAAAVPPRKRLLVSPSA